MIEDNNKPNTQHQGENQGIGKDAMDNQLTVPEEPIPKTEREDQMVDTAGLVIVNQNTFAP